MKAIRIHSHGGPDVLRQDDVPVPGPQSSGPVPPFDPQLLNRKGSLFLTRPSLSHYVATREELLQRAGQVLGWVADGSLTVRVGREYPMAEAADAQRALAARETTGKLLLLP